MEADSRTPPGAREHDDERSGGEGGGADESGYEGAGVEEGGGYQRSPEESGGYEQSGKEGEYDPRREGEEP
jgi:hypothetical protein